MSQGPFLPHSLELLPSSFLSTHSVFDTTYVAQETPHILTYGSILPSPTVFFSFHLTFFHLSGVLWFNWFWSFLQPSSYLLVNEGSDSVPSSHGSPEIAAKVPAGAGDRVTHVTHSQCDTAEIWIVTSGSLPVVGFIPCSLSKVLSFQTNSKTVCGV